MSFSDNNTISNRNKIIAYTIMLLAPFFSLIIALRNWNSNYSKNIIIGVIVFIGMTALPEGDLERYQENYYINASLSLEMMWNNLISLKEGKFYINFFSFFFGILFKHHNIYFGFLYFIFGFYLVNFIYLVLEKNIKIIETRFGIFFFISFALFFSIRNSTNLAFYTGAIFSLYWLAKAILNDEKKYLGYLLLAPLFHSALALIFLPVIFFLILNLKTKICIFIAIISFVIPGNLVTNSLGDFANQNEDTVIQDKYKSYGSEEGKNRLNKRYEEGVNSANFKLSLSNNIKQLIFDYLLNIGLFISLFYKKKLIFNKIQHQLLNLILLLLSLSNIMLHVSNGVRFQIFNLTLTIVLMILIYNNTIKAKLFLYYLYLTIPTLFLFGIMALYASNKFISLNFFVSNYFIEVINPT